MGLYSDAELIWGFPVLDHDEESGEPTGFWQEEFADWRQFENCLELHTYGHYEDPDARRAILTSNKVLHFMGDCWEPKHVPGLFVPQQQVRIANAALIDEGLFSADLDFTNAKWWLVASYG
jgi:hypothetical protein